MRTVEGPFCNVCGDGVVRIDPKDASVGDGYWSHINNDDDHRVIVQYRVIKKS